MPRDRKPPSLTRARWLRDPVLQRLLETLSADGGEARVVGGAVRNALMNLPVNDVDVATTLEPADVARLCKRAGFGIHPTGIEHGTLTIVSGGRPFEVTTLRKDIETDGRRAVVQFTNDWAIDAGRRDFTINALYVDRAGKIFDFTDGYSDILQRRIRFIGSPVQRIREDYLRILRFFRFHAQFGAGRPLAADLAACKREVRGMTSLSADRIRQELFKLLEAPGATATLKLMARHGILKRVLPHGTKWRVIERLPAVAILRLSALAEKPEALRERLNLSNRDTERLHAILDAPEISLRLSARECHRLLYLMGAQGWRDAVALARARDRTGRDKSWARLARLAERWQRPVFPINGGHLIQLGIKPGPRMGEMLRMLEDWWIASDFKPDKNQLLTQLASIS